MRMAVVAIECVAGGSRAEEWAPGSSEMVQTGDVVVELRIGGGRDAAAVARAPFKGGKGGVQKLLHSAYKRGDTSIEVRVRRPVHGGTEAVAADAAMARMQACIVPRQAAGGGSAVVVVGRRHYVLRSIRDPNYAVGFVDRMESECIALQERNLGAEVFGRDLMTPDDKMEPELSQTGLYHADHAILGAQYPVYLIYYLCLFHLITCNLHSVLGLCICVLKCRPAGSRNSRVVCALSKAQLQDGYVLYPWEKKMKEALPISNSSSFLSMLILPKALDRSATRYNSVEDTLARAQAWLQSSQNSGVPVVFMNVQTEALLTKISGETASATVNSGSLADLSNLANASLYGFEDYHGVDIGVVKAVRIWYTAAARELPVEVTLQEGDTRLGFAISRTDEGFIYISSVIEDDDDQKVPSTRSGLRDLYREAKSASKLLVVSRVSNHKVLPWMVSTSGAIRCFDTVSLSQKLSLHRHALRPILLHVLTWEKPGILTSGVTHPSEPSPPPQPFPAFSELRQNSFSSGEHPGSALMQERDTAGDISFRFHDFSLPNNWV